MNASSVQEIADLGLLFVKRTHGKLRPAAGDSFEVYDPQLHSLVLRCGEPDLDVVQKLFRLSGHAKNKTSFNVEMNLPTEALALRIKTSNGFLHTGFRISDDKEQPLLRFRRKFLDLRPGASYRSFDAAGKEGRLLTVRSGLNRYRLQLDRKDAAEVSLKWKGAHDDFFREGFASVISIADDVPRGDTWRQILLACALCVHRIRG